jgi:3-dehydro-4-phosphotetronate decarboxylase
MNTLTDAGLNWHQTQRREIVRIGASLFARGYVHATAGNISVRVPAQHGGGVLITPTDACLGFLHEGDPVWVGDDEQPRSPGKASKTIRLHRAIYAADAHAQSVIHTHSTHLVAMTLAQPDCVLGQDLLPPLTPYFVMKVGHVPRVPYHRPGDPQAAACVSTLIGQAQAQGVRLHAVMLDRLGPNVWHENLSAAMATLEELEETARLAMLLSPPSNTPLRVLDAAQVQELRQHFNASW